MITPSVPRREFGTLSRVAFPAVSVPDEQANLSGDSDKIPLEDNRLEQDNQTTPEQKAKQKSKFNLGIVMNPAVLSIISHFPNKCIPKKTEKYVINGMPPPESGNGTDLKAKITTDKTNNNLPTSKPLQQATTQKKRPSSKFKRYAGLLLAILSSMMFSFTGLIVKVINHHHPLTQATWMFVGTVVLAIPLNLLKYVYTYHSNRINKDTNEKSETFKQSPDIIEPVKMFANEVISEKLQISNKTTEATVGVDLINSTSLTNKIALRRQLERRRKLKQFILLLIRACSGCSGMILYFYSLKYLNVGDSLVIVCSSPIFVFIIGYLFLGESCGVIPILTILLTMAGVSVITRPPMLTGKENFEKEDMIGAGLAFSSMLCIAMTIIMMRFLQNVYHGLINLVFGIWGTIQTTTLALAMGVLECPRDWHDAVLMSATGVLFFLGQTFLAVALQFEEAGPVSLVRTSEVVFAFVWQFIFLRVSPDWFSISGAGLILAGIFLTISRKWIAALPETSPSRKMFSFLLR